MASTIGKFVKSLFGEKTLKENSIVINNPQTVIIQSPKSTDSVPYYDDETEQTQSSELKSVESQKQKDLEYYDDESTGNEKEVVEPVESDTYDDLTGQNDEEDSDNIYDEDIENNEESEEIPEQENVPNQNNEVDEDTQEDYDDNYYDEDEDATSEIESEYPNPELEQEYDEEPQLEQEVEQNTEVEQQPYYDDDVNVSPQIPATAPAEPVQSQMQMQMQMPVQNPAMMQAPAIDPNTGQPLTPSPTQAPMIDPNTGQPIENAEVEPYEDEDDWDIGSSENDPDSGTPVKIKDINRISELRYIYEKLNDLKEILDNELSIKYERANKKVKDTLEFFNLVITNLDSYKEQIDELILKFKRFLYVATIEINKMKEEDIEEYDDEI